MRRFLYTIFFINIIYFAELHFVEIKRPDIQAVGNDTRILHKYAKEIFGLSCGNFTNNQEQCNQLEAVHAFTESSRSADDNTVECSHVIAIRSLLFYEICPKIFSQLELSEFLKNNKILNQNNITKFQNSMFQQYRYEKLVQVLRTLQKIAKDLDVKSSHYKNKVKSYGNLYDMLTYISLNVVNSVGIEHKHSLHSRSDHGHGHDHAHDHGHDHGHNDSDINHDPEKKKFNYKGCLGAFVSCIVISLLGFLGLILIPLKNKVTAYKFTLQCLTALAFATLTGDALLHLLPHGLKLHDHSHDGSSHSHSHGGHSHSANELLAADSYIWKFSVLLLGIFIFYLIEIVVIISPAFGGHECEFHKNKDKARCTHTHGASVESNLSGIEARKKSKSSVANKAIANLTEHVVNTHNVHGGIAMDAVTNLDNFPLSKCEEDIHFDSSEKMVSVEKTCDHKKGLKSVVLMLLIGDTFHHVLDGLALGAAFIVAWPTGAQLGISTSIAIACHELPHMLGDIALLIKTGHSVLKSTLLVIFSSSTSMLGVVIGVASSYTSVDAPLWIDVFTSGMFIYIALTQLNPQLVSAFKTREISFILIALSQGIGFIIGYLLMYVIAIYEDQIYFK